jgi:hypothetical protein
MSEKGDYPIWDKWYSIAGPVNKFIAFAIIGLAVLGWILSGFIFGFFFSYLLFLTWNIVSMILGVVAGILYLLMVMKPVTDKALTKKMHIVLLICEVLCWLSWWPVGALMTLQFVMVGILSDKPFWVALGE